MIPAFVGMLLDMSIDPHTWGVTRYNASGPVAVGALVVGIGIVVAAVIRGRRINRRDHR